MKIVKKKKHKILVKIKQIILNTPVILYSIMNMIILWFNITYDTAFTYKLYIVPIQYL